MYTHPTLDHQGFIHCSRPSQVLDVAAATREHFRQQEPLVLLCIDESRVDPPVRYERADSEEFPHVYGPLNCDAVIETFPFKRGAGGRYELPPRSTD